MTNRLACACATTSQRRMPPPMNTTPYDWDAEMDETESVWDDDDPVITVTPADARAQLDRLAAPDPLGVDGAMFVSDAIPRAGFVETWVAWALIVVAVVLFALTLDALLNKARSADVTDTLPFSMLSPPFISGKAGEFNTMLRLSVNIIPGVEDQDMCVMASSMPPNAETVCLIQYRAGGTLVFPRGFAVSIERLR